MAKRRDENAESKTGSAGRSRTVERRKEKQQQERRQQQTYVAIALVAIVVVGALLFVLTKAVPAEAPIPEEALTRYEGLETSFTAEGYPMLGSEDAPVQVVEYSSFGCSACANFHETYYDRLVEFVRSGQVSLTFVPIVTTGSIAGREGAAYAALCAAEQNKFWEFHDTLFNWQLTFANTAFTSNRLSAGAEKLGLDMSAYNTCLGSSRPGQVVQTAQDKAATFANFGTPRIEVDGTYIEDWATLPQAIQQRIDFNASQSPAVEPTTQPVVEPTVEATIEAAEPTQEATPEATP